MRDAGHRTPDAGHRTSDNGHRTSDGEKSKNNISTPQGGGHNSSGWLKISINFVLKNIIKTRSAQTTQNNAVRISLRTFI